MYLWTKEMVNSIFIKNSNGLRYHLYTLKYYLSKRITIIVRDLPLIIIYPIEHPTPYKTLWKIRKNKTDKGPNSFTCVICLKSYVGQTGRTFEIRVKEHERSYINKRTDSTIVIFCIVALYNVSAPRYHCHMLIAN